MIKQIAQNKNAHPDSENNPVSSTIKKRSVYVMKDLLDLFSFD
jgi:hypothetical protein